MPQQEPRQRLGVRRDVERLVGGHAGELAGGDVADRVAARLARRQAGVGEPAHRRFDVVQLHEVQLHVLPRRDVAEAARVLLGHVGERVQLLAGQHALRDLHADHLRIVGLPLAVGAAHQPEDAPLLGRDLAALELPEHVGELVDVGFAGERQARAPERARVDRMRMDMVPSPCGRAATAVVMHRRSGKRRDLADRRWCLARRHDVAGTTAHAASVAERRRARSTCSGVRGAEHDRGRRVGTSSRARAS